MIRSANRKDTSPRQPNRVPFLNPALVELSTELCLLDLHSAAGSLHPQPLRGVPHRDIPKDALAKRSRARKVFIEFIRGGKAAQVT